MSRVDNGNDKDQKEDSKDKHIPDPDPPDRDEHIPDPDPPDEETANKPDKNEKR